MPGLARLRALTAGRPEVRIAALDGPMDPGAVAAELQLSGMGHGTLVGSIIAGSRDGLTPGVAPGCALISIPVFDGDPGRGCSQADMAKAIDEALARRANIINISAAQQADATALSAELAGAIGRALEADALIVASTGNHGCSCDTIPASVPGVLAVGAHGADGAPLVSSNWGAGHRSQGMLAPGAEVSGACVGGGVCRGTGTSFAAAATSGVAGLLMSVLVEAGEPPSGARVRRLLLETSDRLTPDDADIRSKYLAGRIDVAAAAERLLGEISQAKQQGVVMETASDVTELQGSPVASDAVAALAEASESAGALALAGDIELADCGCGGKCGGEKAKPLQLVYAIGRLGVSFTSTTRRDALWRAINGAEAGTQQSKTPEVDLRPIANASLQNLFKREPWQAQAVVWTLSRSDVPMYAIAPTGAFAESAMRWLVEQWSDPEVEFISLPGVIAGRAVLYDGMEVDVVVPDMRGMYSWNSARYTEALLATLPRPEGEKKSVRSGEADAERIRRFLSKIYYRIRNRGLTPEERALNSAATNAFNMSDVVVTAGREGLAFKDVSVEKSPFNRPGGQYYDVLLTFFSPTERNEKAPLVARFTIDVSDTVPVLVGEPVEWYEY